MVRIIYYPDPVNPAAEIGEYPTVADFILSKFTTRDQVLDLRFFDEEILGHEIDQKGGEFLSINEGVVAVTHDSMIPRDPITWVYVIIAVVFAATVILLKPKIPELGGNDQQSGTNRLGDSTNEPRINQRIDDIFGTVTKHTPPLWQVPYRIGVNNQETEVLLLCVGRGRYDIDLDNWYDGDTPVNRIPNAQVSIYEPGTHPGNGSPAQQIGATVAERIGIYRQSNDLNPAELIPPNELENTGIVWSLNATGSIATLTSVFIPEGANFTQLFTVGSMVKMTGCYYFTDVETVMLYDFNGQIYSVRDFTVHNTRIDLGADGTLLYEVLTVSSNTITLQIPADASPAVLSAWSSMINYLLPFSANRVFIAPHPTATFNVWLLDNLIEFGDYFYRTDDGEYLPLTRVNEMFNHAVGTENTVGAIGPIFIPKKSTEVILNFVSPSGFYKLVDNSERLVSITIKVTIYELDNNGVQTGETTIVNVGYSSNQSDKGVRQSVFRTMRIVLPYENQSISAERVTNRDKGGNVSNVDNVEWRDLYSFEPIRAKFVTQTFNANTFIAGAAFILDNVQPSVLTALSLKEGIPAVSVSIKVVIPSQNVDATLQIGSIASFGTNGNFSINFNSIPAGAIIAQNASVTLTRSDVIDFGDVTLAHVVIPSNSQSRLVKQRKQNVTLTRKITQYFGNGVFGSVESYATDQFDQILVHVMLDRYIGRLTLDDINADGFMMLRNEIENYFGTSEMCRFGYDFDDANVTTQDTFMMICDVMMCVPYVQTGVYDAFFEKRQDVSTMQVTCRNKLLDSETRRIVYDRKNDGVEITYRSNVTGVSETVYIPQDRSSVNPERITLKGCTSELQAYRYGSRIYNKQLHQIEFIKFDVDEFGRNIIPGKRLDSPDSTRFTKRPGVTDGYRVYDGEVIEVRCLEVELSEPVEFITGEDHYITFTKQNGDNGESILCTKVNDFTILLSALPSEPIYDGYSRDRTKYMFVSEQLKDSVALLPQTIEYSVSDDGSEVNTISLTNYTDKFYKDDLSFPNED